MFLFINFHQNMIMWKKFEISLFKQCNIFWCESAFQTAQRDEVHIVVLDRVVREKLVRTRLVLTWSIAYFMVAEVLVPKHLKWGVFVGHIFERKMRDQILVVNHPVQSVNSSCNILSHCFIADPWASKTVNLHLLVEFSLQPHPCYFRKSSPHTVPGC